jgi:hypothetical protein
MPAEAINSYGVTVGTATTPIVGMSADAQIAVVQNQQPTNEPDDYAREGLLFLVAQTFTVNSPGTASFGFTTGANGAQIDFYEIISTVENVSARLVEGATVSTTGAAIPVYNLNRNYSDTITSELKSATAVSGGSAISQEYVTADKHAAGGGSTSGKVHTLKPSTTYALQFINDGNQTTKVFFQMGFAEKYNGHNDVWLGGSVGDGVRLRGGESMQLPMIQGQTLSAVASEDNQVGVLRQD